VVQEKLSGKTIWGFREPLSILEYSYHTDTFSEEECKSIIEIDGEYKKSNTIRETVGKRDSSNLWLYPEGNEWIYRRLVDCITAVNSSIYNYKLVGLETLQLTKYEVGGFYSEHADMDDQDTMYDSQRKLSFSVQLSHESDYSGGDLVFPVGDNLTVCKKDVGLLISFPSYKVHRVEKVTSGTRYSLVGWVNGPSFV